MAAKEKDPVVSLQVISVLLLGALVTILAGCSPSEPEGQAKVPPGTIVLTGAGNTSHRCSISGGSVSTTIIIQKLSSSTKLLAAVKAFAALSGKNIAEDEKVDFGASDAAMSDAEIARADNNALMVPVTAGCVVLAYPVRRPKPQAFAPGLFRDLSWRDQ